MSKGNGWTNQRKMPKNNWNFFCSIGEHWDRLHSNELELYVLGCCFFFSLVCEWNDGSRGQAEDCNSAMSVIYRHRPISRSC